MPDLYKRVGQVKYEFTARTWKYEGKGAWLFVSFPAEISREIRANLKWQEEGWGRLKAAAKTGGSKWETAIWFDTKHDTYLLPLKAEIKRKEKIGMDQDLDITVWV